MKDIYLQKNDKKLMMIKDQNGITMDIKKLQQNNSETITNENDKEIPKEIYLST